MVSGIPGVTGRRMLGSGLDDQPAQGAQGVLEVQLFELLHQRPVCVGQIRPDLSMVLIGAKQRVQSCATKHRTGKRRRAPNMSRNALDAYYSA